MLGLSLLMQLVHLRFFFFDDCFQRFNLLEKRVVLSAVLIVCFRMRVLFSLVIITVVPPLVVLSTLLVRLDLWRGHLLVPRVLLV
jgi:hypothetical protein